MVNTHKHNSLHAAMRILHVRKSLHGRTERGGRVKCMYVLNQSALPIIHGINGDTQRGRWDDRDLHNDWNGSVWVCVCVYCIGIKE